MVKTERLTPRIVWDPFLMVVDAVDYPLSATLDEWRNTGREIPPSTMVFLQAISAL